jgi:hypothetical protein
MGVAVVKNTLARSAMQNVVDQWIVASKASATLPATTTQNLFTISGGRVLVKGLIGEVTTVVQAQACNLKVSVDPSGGGTTYDVAANHALLRRRRRDRAARCECGRSHDRHRQRLRVQSGHGADHDLRDEHGRNQVGSVLRPAGSGRARRLGVVH